MRRLFWLFVLGCVCLWTTGCDPIRWMRGSVQTVPDPAAQAEGDVYSSGEPVSGAEIEHVCPDHREVVAETDEQGRFEVVDIGLWRTDCKIRVSHPDYASREFDVEELCLAMFGQTTCHRLAIQAELTGAREEEG